MLKWLVRLLKSNGQTNSFFEILKKECMTVRPTLCQHTWNFNEKCSRREVIANFNLEGDLLDYDYVKGRLMWLALRKN